jgi:hypothetical protein
LSKLEEDIRCENVKSTEMTTECVNIQQQMTELNSIIFEKENIKKELHTIVSQRALLSAENEKIKDEIAHLNIKIESDNQAILDVEDKLKALTSRKQTNDMKEVEVVIPARAELEELKSENEKLELFLENMKSKQVEDELVLLEKERYIEKLQFEIDEASKEVEVKQQVVDSSRELLSLTTDASEDKVRNLEMKKEESTKRILELEKQVQDMKNQEKGLLKTNRMQEEADELELQFLRKQMELIRKGKGVLDKTASKVKSILEGKHESKHRSKHNKSHRTKSHSTKPNNET